MYILHSPNKSQKFPHFDRLSAQYSHKSSLFLRFRDKGFLNFALIPSLSSAMVSILEFELVICDKAEGRPMMRPKTIFYFIDEDPESTVKFCEADLCPVDESYCTKHDFFYLDPHDDAGKVLRDRDEIKSDPVIEHLESVISSLFADFDSGGVPVRVRVRVVENNDDDDDGGGDGADENEICDSDIVDATHGQTKPVLPEIPESDVGVEEEEDVGVREDLAPPGPSEEQDDLDLPEISDSSIYLEREPIGDLGEYMDMDMDMEEYEEYEEYLEYEFVPQEMGVPEDVLTRLKQEGGTQAQSLKKRNLDSADCVVCMEQFSDSDTVINMPCSHVFHQQCIFEWLRTWNTCPLCRRVPYEDLGP